MLCQCIVQCKYANSSLLERSYGVHNNSYPDCNKVLIYANKGLTFKVYCDKMRHK